MHRRHRSIRIAAIPALLACCILFPAMAWTGADRPAMAPAQAKPAKPARIVQPRIPVRPAPVAAATWSTANASIDDLRDHGDAANQPALPGVVALRGFQLRFRNGDHKLRRIAVLPGDRFTRFSLSDSNGDDGFSANAMYATFSAGSVGEVGARGGGKFEIQLPGNPPPGHTLVLRGFEFRRRDGTDANLRNIGVWMDSARRVARVSLIDDQGLDVRGFEATIGAVFTGAALLPGAMEAMSVTNSEAMRARAIPQQVDGYRAYEVTVQYAWIPNALVQQQGAISGTHRSRVASPASPIDALQGFEFTFNNSDHHLLGLGVNGSGGNEVLFRDNNRDDPMQWSATYVTLRPERKR